MRASKVVRHWCGMGFWDHPQGGQQCYKPGGRATPRSRAHCYEVAMHMLRYFGAWRDVWSR